MTYAVRSQRDLLSVLAKSKRSQRRVLLQGAKKSLIDAISECVYNTLQGKVKLNKTQKTRLSKHLGKLRKIASKKLSWKRKRNILVQDGCGFFSFLFPIISSIIGAIAGNQS